MEKFNITDNDWYFDGDALIEWVSKCTNNEKNIETVITNVYPMEADENNNVESLGGLVPIMETPRKEITETKNSKNELFSTTRINFIFSIC